MMLSENKHNALNFCVDDKTLNFYILLLTNRSLLSLLSFQYIYVTFIGLNQYSIYVTMSIIYSQLNRKSYTIIFPSYKIFVLFGVHNCLFVYMYKNKHTNTQKDNYEHQREQKFYRKEK